MKSVTILFASYFVGSVPFGLIIARWWAGIDVREHGSGNIGATNVYRVVGKPAGVVVFLLDMLKGMWAPLVAHYVLHLPPWWQVGAGLAAILGHSASPFLGFKGGKGVATSLGVLFGLAWQTGVICFALWGILLWITGYVSVASIIASLSATPFIAVFYPGDYARLIMAVVGGLMILYKHRSNIDRLRKGEERNIRNKGKSEN
jgi:glycerol-3-phosphate acyltransferase PlsY